MTPEREQLLDQQYAYPCLEAHPGYWGECKQAVILGLNSDIAKGLKERLEVDQWVVNGTCRENTAYPTAQWDLLIVAMGTMEPIGKFFDVPQSDWERSLWVNALRPLELIRCVWNNRRAGARVVFMSGPNPNVPTPTYTAYRAGKAILQSLVETLNAEYPDTKFCWFIPGVVNTKIHYQTLAAGERAANRERVLKIVNGTEPTVSYDDLYAKLKALL